MAVQLDHLLVPSAGRDKAARCLAELLGVSWGPANIGPFSAVYVNDGLTVDFDQWDQAFPKGHYCFRVNDAEFDEILQRIRNSGIPFRSTPHGPVDSTVNTTLGSRIVYWSEPDGHTWELLTQSYARRDHRRDALPRSAG